MLILQHWAVFNPEQKTRAIEYYSDLCHFTDGEKKRLVDSLVVVDRFIEEAHKIAKYRDHYSARTIVEVLRHNSVLQDGDKTFKINDHLVPLLSRLSMQMFPALNNLFEIRSQKFKLIGGSYNG